ncbi:MAG: EAL domain-containing protein [Acidimicrobiales bacterium]|jgi:diguanylate cyclase (GGDEF)-like protein/PAS domain S-box-containing protein
MRTRAATPSGASSAEFPPEQLLSAVVESSDDAIVATSLHGTIKSWNTAAEALYGWTKAEAIGHSIEMIVPEARREEVSTLVAGLTQGGRLGHFETTRVRKDGSEMYLAMTVSPIRDFDGRVIGFSSIAHDVTEDRRREREVAESLRLFVQAQQVGHIGGWTSEVAPGDHMTWTGETFRIFGLEERSDLRVADFRERVHPDDVERVEAAKRSTVEQGRRLEIEYRIVRPDGTERWVHEVADVITEENGARVKLVGVTQDVTDWHEAGDTKRSLESQLRVLIENSKDLVFRYRLIPDPAFEYVSPALLAITGYTPDEFYADPDLVDKVFDPSTSALALARASTEEGKSPLDIEITRKDGSRSWVSLHINAVQGAGGELVAVEGILRDISDRKLAERQLEHEVLHDPLTGLPNRVLTMDRMEHGLARAVREGGLVAVLLVDLDRFKVFNDTRGHAWGDSVLQAVAARLAANSRGGDTLGRFSGDEFIIVCERLAATTDAITIAAHALDVFATPFDVGGEKVHVSASIGIATGKGSAGAEKLLRDADLAKYRAKDRGRARYEVFDDTLRAEVERRAMTEAGLRRAIENDEFGLVFQPVWSMAQERFVGAEALLRWHDPLRGTVSPDDFIPVAEECGLIVPIGEWVLKVACESVARWNAMGGLPTALSMSVNVSAVQLRSESFPRAVAAIIAAAGIDPRLICLEITESVLMEDVDYFSSVLRELQAIGTRLSIDDFGTGYSSLAYLRRFPVNELKIDRSFITNLDSEPFDATLVSAVVAIGEALGLRVVPEGIETTEELAAAAGLGCQYAQGFLLARPCDFDSCVTFLAGTAATGATGQRQSV